VPDEEPDQSVKLQWRGSGGPGSKLVIEMLARGPPCACCAIASTNAIVR
jgi:hypothetical protein